MTHKAFDNVPLDSRWEKWLAPELQQDYMHKLQHFLEDRTLQGHIVFPQKSHYFHALNLLPPDAVKVVILGQDPYHGDGQAHGLSFSVQENTPIPPSLRNIYKELVTDIDDFVPPPHGHLEHWARQGVLLLNTVLTVERGNPASHKEHGWERLTDTIIRIINTQSHPVVFMLWGAHAQKKVAMINQSKHYVLKAPHPSPLSAHRGFLGCQHFSKANLFLRQHNRSPIDWHLPVHAHAY